MNCRQWSAEISERSRRGAAPGEDLARHLAECPDCAGRWQRETELSRDLGTVRQAAAGLRSSDSARARLLAEFDARHAPAPSSRWVWGAIAATAVVAVALTFLRQPVPTPKAPSQAATEVAAEEVLADNDFVPVPYAPPLAQGEMVEVVRMDLSPAALARMGFVTQAGYTGDVTTDLVVGEDGLPRAVRVPESVEIRF